MPETIPGSRFIDLFEKGIALFLIFFLFLIIAISLVVLTVLFVTKIWAALPTINTAADMQEAMQRSFSGVLLILLGLELLETVKVYFAQHQIRVETILIVALIALGRHVLIIDLHHANAYNLYGIAALIIVLSGSFYLVRKGRLLGEI